jgi:hypothetical protein
VILRAAAALPDDDRQRATQELRQQLHVMAVAADVAPDWSTLTVTGPTEMEEADQGARFEWTAVVAVREATTPEEPRQAIPVALDCPSPVQSADAEVGRHLQGLSGG